ncbi:MAG: DUF4402 domain-containing protein [Proteobacteria bacterium]|nr:DUF4402 domain-containing protein [Pseudomonadota bacterium]
MRIFKATFCAILLSGIWLAPVQAQSLLENQSISFGTFGLVPVQTSGQVIIDLAGTTTVSGAVISTAPGQVGNFTVAGFPSLTQVTITASQVTALSTAGSPPGATLSLSDFVFPDPAIIGNDTQLNFDMGATMTTDGTIIDYVAGAYSGTIMITVVVP